MSSELKQLFHSPEDLSDSELEILRVKLQNMRRLPKIAAGFGLVSAALIQSVFLRRSPTWFGMGVGVAAGYAFGGYGASSTMTSNILSRNFDYDIILAQEKRQLRRTMNLAGYGQDHISSGSTNGNKSWDKPY